MAWVFAVAVLTLLSGDASAHSVLGITGFSGGLLHPLLVPTHAVAVVSLALLTGQRRWLRDLALFYSMALAAGLGAIALAYVPTFAEEALLALTTATGLLVAVAWPLPVSLGAMLAAGIGLALGLDSPPEAISIGEANRALLGTALSATAMFAALAWLVSHLRRDWQRIAIRIAGSWIAASAVMVLALRVVGA